MKTPRILFLDIETAPLLAYVWQLFDQNIPLNMIKKDWHILSFAAKWLGDSVDKIVYVDQRNCPKIENDKHLLKKIHKLMDEADIIVTQNGKRFDIKKLNARFVLNGLKPPSSFKQIDTYQIAKKHFGFTSNKLEYMTEMLCVKYKKQKHKKFPGFELWDQCLKGNIEAWKEMENYNKYDILSLEEIFHVLIPWDNSINFNLYSNSEENVCKCGNKQFVRNGYYYTNVEKFQRYKCNKCGSETRDRKNLLTQDKKDSLKIPTR